MIAKLLEARPSFSNLFGLRLSPSKTSLTGQPPPSPLPQAHGSGGGLTPSRTSHQWDTVPVSDPGETDRVLDRCKPAARCALASTASC